MKPLRHSLAGLLLLGAGAALAHAEFETATPAQNSTVTTLPTEITLTFSEEVEVRFSLFKVYKLMETALAEAATPTAETAAQEERGDEHGDEADEREDDHESADENPNPEQLRLNGLAGAMVSQVLETKGDEDARADVGTATEATSKTVTLNLKPDLTAGTYVVMWRALSVDTHTEDGYYVFTYQPTP